MRTKKCLRFLAMTVAVLAGSGSVAPVFSQKAAVFSFDESNGTATTTEALSGTSFDIRNHFDRPERINGVEGSALRFDGWSTWIEKDFNVGGIDRSLSIEAWHATESFSPSNFAIVSQENATSGLSLEVEPHGKVVLIFWADNVRYVLVTDRALKPYVWNHVAVTIDLDAAKAFIFVNAEVWKETALGNHVSINLSANTFYIGRDTDWAMTAGFPMTVMNGALDELVFHQNALTSATISGNYALHAGKVPDLTIDPVYRHAGDELRPRYHAMPNTSWTNESYGLTHYNGKYHLFFQKNPNGPYLHFMHWGHLSSPDMVEWKEEKIPLAPSPGFDNFGVWSGTTVKNDEGKPVIFYTGVNGVKAGIGLALPKDNELIEWEKSPSNPVVPEAPSDIRNLDFRDPYVWKYNDAYYMIIGSGLQNSSGGYLFTYKSTDLVTWTRAAALYNDPNVERSGFFWEMPFFHQLNDKDWILCVTPTPSNLGRAKSIYWIGSFNGTKFTPYDLTPKSFELISENLLSPSIGTDANGKLAYLAIIPEDRNVDAQIAAGWRHMFSLPRTLRLLNDSTVGHIPHPNLCRLRYDQVSVTDRMIVPDTKNNVPEITGNQIELDFTIRADSAAKFSIHVFKSPDESEFTSLYFDLEQNLVGLDRSLSTLSLAAKDKRETKYIFDHREPIRVNIFLDRSVLEVFIDNVVVFSCRVYPSKVESRSVDMIVSDKTARILRLDAWKMKDMVAVASAEVCEPDPASLPDALRKEIAGIVLDTGDDLGKFGLTVYPNPARDIIRLHYSGDRVHNDLGLRVYSQSGIVISHQAFSTETLPEITGLAPGIYYVRISSARQTRVFKVVVVK